MAQDIGPEACWLLTVIVHQEDAKRYRGAVTYYNEQLMPLCGFSSAGRLIRARDKAVEAGWLHYQPGYKGKPGIYWCIIPGDCESIPDTPMDEDSAPDIPFQNRNGNGRKAEGKRRETVVKTEGNRSESGNLPTLSLDPIPIKPPNPLAGGRSPAAKAVWKIRKRDMETLQRLDAWILKNLPSPHSENLRIKVLACAICSMRDAKRSPTRMFLAMLEKGMAGQWSVPDEDIQAASREIGKHKAEKRNSEPESIGEILRRRNGT
jgi:hypothetical protein